jgi:glycine cleavage system aminomethyltransferase T/NADPH-dependent 2,4-dienoyl-CoA reductase/sulfur reductase-like enzyme
VTARWRLPTGGVIDRSRPITFNFDGRAYQGFAGDTLASALLAHGVKLLGRSFKYHRPRGILSAGVEEPNALVSVGEGGRYEPNTRATDVFIYEGLTAVSQNRWPSLAFDLGSVNRLIARFIPAGFYYKTFFGGPRLWLFFEHFIRRAAGLGKAPRRPDPDAFEHRAAFCDVLVVGAGPAGLAAAEEAVAAGQRVILVEQDRRDMEGTGQRIAAAGGRVLTRTTAAGFWDHGLVTLVQRLVEAGQAPGKDGLVQRLWRVRAGRVILATGAIERPLLFSGNDTPGVMLSSAVRAYVQRFAVLPGQRVVIATCNDDGYATALAVLEAGGQIAALLDSRPSADGDIVGKVKERAPVHFGALPLAATGGAGGVTGLEALADGRVLRLACDLIAVSGGFTPVTHLHMQAGGTLAWNEALAAFVPAAARQGQVSVGAGAGEGLPAGFSYDPAPGVRLKTAFVDYQNDVTVADLDLAWREGYRSVEHMKRYTTLGMATDQGKTSNLMGLARLAKAEGRPMPEVGLTTFRPPYTPVTLGTLAGEAVGDDVAPHRYLPLHARHLKAGALWQPSGYWSRPRAFPRPGESLEVAALREARSVRVTLGLTDVSSLAKFEIAGPDAAAFLERVCATTAAKLAVGRGRYTFMLREDGFVFDDGTLWRLAEQRYLLTSSTGGADRMTAHLSYVRRVLAPEMRVSVVGVQEHWGAAALAGPFARACVHELMESEAPRHMSATTGRIADIPVMVLAVSYSGERAFEIYAAAPDIDPVWTALACATLARGGALYGLEALELLRIEKGHPEVGAEIDGRRTPADLGLAKMLNPRGGYVGAAGLSRPALQAKDRQTLVGLVSGEPIPEGAMLAPSAGADPEGHVSSSGPRLTGQGAVALGLLARGGERMGETLLARSPTRGKTAQVRVVAPHFHDPAGERYRD